MPDSPSSLQINSLGGLQVLLNGKPLAGFVSTKVQALLIYLAVTGRPQAREKLIGLLWAAMPDADAKTNLRQALSNLRKLLPDHVSIERDAAAFNRDSLHLIDVECFETHLKTDRLAAAMEIYHGDFLEGFAVRDAPEFEEWALTQREHWHELALQALHTLTQRALQEGRYTDGIEAARRTLTLDPWREEAHRQLMLLQARSGQFSAALAQYETCRRLLSTELGVEPLPETTALHDRIKAARSSPRHNLPGQVTPFVGREREVATIVERLHDPACQLLTLIGPGGSGKTRLALQAASQCLGAFLNGVFFVSLAALQTTDLIVPAIAHALRFDFHGQSDLKTEFLNYLRDKEVLLLLDNFEHLIDASHLMSEILQDAPAVKLLVTSRERLNLRREWLMEVPGLQVPPHDCAPDELDDYSAAALFLQNARRVRSDLALNAANAAAIARICRLVDGLPLGLELAATWTHSLDCSSIAAEIERGLDILSTTQPDVPARQRSLRTVFDHSWQRLSAAEQVLFRRLAVFRGGFQREAAEAVCDASLDGLTSLIEKSLLQRRADGRFEMHELIYQYAREQLSAAPGEWAQLRDRHCRYFAAYALQRQDRLKGDTPTVPRAEIQQELDNVRSGWQQAVASAQAPLIEAIEQYLEGLFVFWEMNSAFVEGERAFAQAAAALEAIGNQPDQRSLILRANLLARQGWYCFRLARFDESNDLIQQSLALLRQLDAWEELGYPLLFAGACAFGSGKLAEAKQLFLESCTVYRRINDTWGIAGVLNNLGQVAVALGEYDEARQFLEESLQVTEAAQIRHLRVHVLGNLSELNLALGEHQAAKPYAQQALVLARDIEEQFSIATQLSRLGAVEMMLGEYIAAEHAFQEALDIATSLSNRWEQAACLNHLGEIMLKLDRPHDAQRHFRQALFLARSIGAASIALNSLRGLACYLVDHGDTLRSLELAYFILHHPDSEQLTKDRARQLSEQLAAKLPSAKVTEALRRGQGGQLDKVIAELLTDAPAHRAAAAV
jgi:predicted ATPase/DNA-binding SARP family transcriptional activator/Tfp pilus assembly protein PilF